MAGYRGRLLVEMALKRAQVNNFTVETSKNYIDSSDNSKTNTPMHNISEVSYDDDTYDFDDESNDPDWVLKSKDRQSLDSTTDTDDSVDNELSKARKRKRSKDRVSSKDRSKVSKSLRVANTLAIVQEASGTQLDKVNIDNSDTDKYSHNEEERQIEENMPAIQNQTTLSDDGLNLETTPIPDLQVIEHEEIVQTSESQNTHVRKSTLQQNQLLRMQGKSYTGRKKDMNGKSKHNVSREARLLGPRCCTSRCDKGWGGRQCSQVDEDMRQEIFTMFWEHLSWAEKKVYVLALVTRKPVARHVTTNDVSRRKNSFLYFLKIQDHRHQVCKSLFLSTLSLKEDTVYNWVNENATNHGIPQLKEPVYGNNSKIEAKERAIQYLQEVPKMPSHYCRAKTSKLYLETEFSSLSELYKHYKETVQAEVKPVYGQTQFRELFKDMNMAFYKPKKDQCDLCTGFKAKTVDEEQYNKHIKRKTEAQTSKAQDKADAVSGNQIVLTMDLQSLLLCPKLEASCLFYKTKLYCHNFTFFDLSSKKVKCYFWNETAADLSASTFATCIIDYLKGLDLSDVDRIILYSDGCAYQNRNITLSCALLQFAVQHGIEIQQKYLEKGHTYMECDSIHATIGRKIKNKDVFIPQKYVELIKESREHSDNPYEVKYVDHSFFKDFTKLSYYSSIRPGQTHESSEIIIIN